MSLVYAPQTFFIRFQQTQSQNVCGSVPFRLAPQSTHGSASAKPQSLLIPVLIPLQLVLSPWRKRRPPSFNTSASTPLWLLSMRAHCSSTQSWSPRRWAHSCASYCSPIRWPTHSSIRSHGCACSWLLEAPRDFAHVVRRQAPRGTFCTLGDARTYERGCCYYRQCVRPEALDECPACCAKAIIESSLLSWEHPVAERAVF